MKSNWTCKSFDSMKTVFKRGFEKTTSTALALVLGLALGFAGGQAVHSSNEPTKETKVPVRAETGFGSSLMLDPWTRNFFRDSFFSDMDSFTDMPVSLGKEMRFSSIFATPRIDTSETANTVTITADVPGIEEKDLEVSVSNDSVTIKGEKRRDSAVAAKDAKRSERFYGTFERSVNLPTRVESDKAEASLKNGVLTIVIPKSQLAQKETRKLTIKTQ